MLCVFPFFKDDVDELYQLFDIVGLVSWVLSVDGPPFLGVILLQCHDIVFLVCNVPTSVQQDIYQSVFFK